jgi:hypothetical protein
LPEPPTYFLQNQQCAQVSERAWIARVEVAGVGGLETRVFQFHLTQRLGGVKDGFWYTSQLISEGNDWSGRMRAAELL